MEESRSAFKILTGKPTGKRFLERSKHKWEDNIKVDIKEIGVNTGKCVDYWRGLMNVALNLRVP